MGLTQGTTQEPAETIRQRPTVQPEICLLCINRYQRPRQSVCTCNHCQLPLCSDCMNEHIDEQPRSIAQLSHQCDTLKELYQTKKEMVQEELSKSNTEIKQCLKTYQNDLLEAHQAIIVGMENAKQDAERYLYRIYSELQTLKVDIETLAEERTFQPERMEALSNQLNQIQDQLETYKMIKETELQIVMPKYTLKFQCIPNSTTDATESSKIESSNLRDNPGKKSSRGNKFHPYKKTSASGGKTNVSSYDGEID